MFNRTKANCNFFLLAPSRERLLEAISIFAGTDNAILRDAELVSNPYGRYTVCSDARLRIDVEDLRLATVSVQTALVVIPEEVVEARAKYDDVARRLDVHSPGLVD